MAPLGLPPRGDQRAQRLSTELGRSRTLADWLLRRGIDGGAARFLNPRLAELSPPELMLDRSVAADRLAAAVRGRERIVVFGDYDCDGMTSAAILTEVLRALGGEVSPLIASRFDGGYGVSQPAVRRILALAPGLVVTCDCGSSDHQSLSDLARRGIDVIVVDHHLVPEEKLPALAFLNPHRPECGFSYKGLASCGLVLSLGAAVRAALGKKLDMRAWLDLVAIGTIADVAPLDGDNRALVRAGLAALGSPRRPGLRALLRQARLDAGSPLSAEDVAFRIAPRLNAPGRLGSPDAALALMLASSEDEAELLAAELEQASVERKAVQEKIIAEALEEIRLQGFERRPALVIGRSGWNHGIVGIVAGRLADRFQRPVVVCGFDGQRGRGSVRGPAGARLHDALRSCQGTLLRFGGHQAAAGVELEFSRLGEFREAFEAAVAATASPSKLDGATDPGSRVWLSAEDPPARVLSDFELLEPCGLLNPAPELVVEARVLSAREVSGGHLKLELELSGQGRLSAFGFSMGDQANITGKNAVLSGRLRPDRYRGQGAVELRIERIF